MPDALKNFWDKNLEEIRANKIRFGAILIIAAAAIIFALSDSAASRRRTYRRNSAGNSRRADSARYRPTA